MMDDFQDSCKRHDLVPFQESADLLDIMWSYLHPNQRQYYECMHMKNLDDLSEEQLLTLHVYDVETFMQQCVNIESVKALDTIHWNQSRLKDLIWRSTRGTLCRTSMLNYALDVIAKMPLKFLHELKFKELFRDTNVACKATCDWYREHDLWEGDAVKEALHYDDAEWFALEIKDDAESHVDMVLDSSYTPVNILCWMASQLDLTSQIGYIFTKFPLKSLQRVYDTMKLEPTQEFTITKIASREWLMFIHSHFTVTNTADELFEMSTIYKLEIALLYNLHLPDGWTLQQARYLDVATLQMIYDRDPDIFKTDITALGFGIDNFRFAMTHGSYVTKPIVFLFPTEIHEEEEDWKWDSRLDRTILEDEIKQLLHSHRLNSVEGRWLAFTLPQFYPPKNWRYNLFFVKAVQGISHWYDWMNVIVEYVDWKNVDISKIIGDLGENLHHIGRYIDMNAVLRRAITDNLNWFTTIHLTCAKYKIPLKIDRSMLEHHWEELDHKHQKALMLMFPQECEGLKAEHQVYHVIQHILKRRKVG